MLVQCASRRSAVLLFCVVCFPVLAAWLSWRALLASDKEVVDVDIWCKAGIGNYLWYHVLQGDSELVENGLRIGRKNFTHEGRLYRLRYVTGPSAVPWRGFTSPGGFWNPDSRPPRNVFLIINGRTEQSVREALEWIKFAQELRPALKNLGVLLHGCEYCRNPWFYDIFKAQSIQLSLVVYSAQRPVKARWPLGVATYRGFPVHCLPQDSPEDLLRRSRKFQANFIGTVYPNSSRVSLRRWMDKHVSDPKFLFKIRSEWEANETEDSVRAYIQALLNSDFTLCPAGKNKESYRIWEALACGSIPVLLDDHEGDCEPSLQELLGDASPVVFLSKWSELERLFSEERGDSVVKRRLEVFRWYGRYKERLQQQFLEELSGFVKH